MPNKKWRIAGINFDFRHMDHLLAFSFAAKNAEVVGFGDLGMEAIYEFEVEDMPVTVAVDSAGTSVHNTGPKEWQARIGKIPVAVA